MSATPVLHHEEQLFDLLNLLDPYAYPVGSFDQFQLRITKRRELGRALLALSRSTKPAFVARHAQRCADLLPDDRYVREIAEACISTPSNDLAQTLLMRHVSSLRIHLTETYRIHRRLVRTRRAALITAGDLLQLRNEEQAIYYDDDELLTEIWQTVEEWRMKAAAQVASRADTDYSLWLQLYLEIAQATVDGPASLSQVFASGRYGLSFPGDESVTERIRDISMRIGDDGSRKVVRRFVREYVGEGLRPAFQQIASFRHELLAECGDRPFVTVLLSATLTPYSLDALYDLFGVPGPIHQVHAVRLRPEPSYWVSHAPDEISQRTRVQEALDHLPRPLIL